MLPASSCRGIVSADRPRAAAVGGTIDADAGKRAEVVAREKHGGRDRVDGQPTLDVHWQGEARRGSDPGCAVVVGAVDALAPGASVEGSGSGGEGLDVSREKGSTGGMPIN